MKGLVIASHAGLGSELLKACELIIGPVQCAQAISVQRQDSVEVVRELFSAAIKAAGTDNEGVLIMTPVPTMKAS